MKIFTSVLVASLISATAPSAQVTQTAEVEKIVRSISDAYNSMSGKTITLRGAIGTIYGDQIYFSNSLGRFLVQFDAGRAARKKNSELRIEYV